MGFDCGLLHYLYSAWWLISGDYVVVLHGYIYCAGVFVPHISLALLLVVYIFMPVIAT